MPVYKVKTQHLIEAIDSVIAQTYGDWELCIVDDHSEDEKIHRILQEYQKRFPEKIKCQFEKINHHISEASNIALKMSTGSYISFLDHDDRLYPNALGEVVRYINLYQNPDILYSDERNISENGEIQNLPFYKPDFSPFLHLSVNYTTHFSTYSRKIYEKIGGLRRGFEGSQDHDFMLRATEATDKEIVHIPFLLYQWRIHPGSSAQGIENKSYAIDAGIKAVSEALHRRKMPGKVGWDTYTQRYRLHLDINGSPKISILIPNKNSPVLLKKCLNSIFEKSTYENFEIIVIDNQSDNQNLQELYSTYLKQYSNFKVVEANFPFNFAKINNLGTSVSTGEYLIFLNNDTEVITNNWIEELLMFAQQPKIGTVGAKLLFEDHTIQHAGIGTFGRMIAGHPGVGLPALSNERYNLYNTVREVIAVTAACMMIKRKSFEDIGMFDEKWCPNGWGDVEFGLRAHEKGYQSIFTPYATLYHSESKTRGVSIEFFEHEYLMNRYPALLLNDPYSNHNLAQNSGFEIHDTRRFELHNRDFVRYLSEHQKDHSSQ
jgi:GT2 family glycosyltransferase